MDDDQDPSECVHAQRHEALFSLCVRIFDGHSHWVTKHLLGMGEADLVFGQVGPALGGVELDVPRLIMLTLCIESIATSYRPKQRSEPAGADSLAQAVNSASEIPRRAASRLAASSSFAQRLIAQLRQVDQIMKLLL